MKNIYVNTQPSDTQYI